MDTDQTPTPRTRKRRSCAREGCNRGVRNGHTCCSYLCDTVAKRQEQAQRMCQAIGPGSISTELWVSVVELGDALTQAQQQEKRIYQLATTQMGFTEAEWSSIKFGESDLARSAATNATAKVTSSQN
jgi:hypothetical protein